MNTSTGKFAPLSEKDVARLIFEYPLAWLVSAVDGEFAATPLPLRPVVDDQGSVVSLLGHFARTNAHVAIVKRVPRTLVLFMGPHGYVSSSWLDDRTRAPTWNYATAQYVVDIQFTEDATETDAVISDLVGAMERDRPRPWSTKDMGPRYERLRNGIIAFKANIVERRVKFKLGQDERDSEFADITRALAASGEDTLLEWMRRENPRRREY
jgi:predicted FMN-binding regulatory protein PaiB